MADRDTITFTITLPIEEYEKLREMMELEKFKSINDVYLKALNSHYHYLKKRQKLGGLVTKMNHHYKKNQN